MNIILASASPRRKEILKSKGYDFKIIPSSYDENITSKKYSKELVEFCAYNKALDVLKNNNGSVIVSADTVVVIDDIILGKPKDKLDAFNTLKKLSDRTHFVSTSICILSSSKKITATDTTYVTFRALSDEDITKYIDTKNPLDKAGSYGIQDDGFDFCIKTEGEIDNIIGFPLKLFEEKLKEFNKE